MTTAEAQAIYDRAGTLDVLARQLDCSKSKAYTWCRDYGVVLQRRGGYRPHPYRRQPRAVRIICREMDRHCVTHDLGADNCAACKARYQQVAGISSLMECAEIVR